MECPLLMVCLLKGGQRDEGCSLSFSRMVMGGDVSWWWWMVAKKAWRVGEILIFTGNNYSVQLRVKRLFSDTVTSSSVRYLSVFIQSQRNDI
jgi:hypothetical protein